jgi:hypothetical protein
MTLPLLKEIIAAARSVNPSQPVSIDVWNDNKRLNDIVFTASDIISFHNYGNKEALQAQITELKKHNRPVINTEWMNRPNGSTIAGNLSVFYDEKVAACYGVW